MGVHRKRKSIVMAIVAPLLVFIGAGALAYGVVVYLWAQGGGTGLPPIGDIATPTITQTAIVGPTDNLSTLSPTPTASSSPKPKPTPPQTAEPVHLDASVVVLNGAKIAGLAGTSADKIKAGGFTAVTVGNISTNVPAANTVRYSDAIYEITARQVAALLGIATVEQGVTPEGNISVILVSQPAK
jgi:LytR cell envelope-related transcriptional attenuator